MRTPRTKSALTKAALTKAAVSTALATTMLGTGFLFTTSAASAADSPYSAAVAECLAGSTRGVALRECLLAVAPRRTPRVVKQSETSTSASRPAVSSANDAPEEESAPVAESAPESAPVPASGNGSDSDSWAQLRECEASGDYGLNDGSGYYGAYQFDLSTWQSIGYEGYPHQASPAVQDEAARLLQSQRGWQPWPACSRKLGLR